MLLCSTAQRHEVYQSDLRDNPTNQHKHHDLFKWQVTLFSQCNGKRRWICCIVNPGNPNTQAIHVYTIIGNSTAKILPIITQKSRFSSNKQLVKHITVFDKMLNVCNVCLTPHGQYRQYVFLCHCCH